VPVSLFTACTCLSFVLVLLVSLTASTCIHLQFPPVPSPFPCPAAHDPPPAAPGGRPRLRLQPGRRDHAA
jgi:hypothetical protein